MMANTEKRDAERAAIVIKAARIHGVSTSLVYKVWDDVRRNEEIMDTIMGLKEGIDDLEQNLTLINAVKKAVTF